MEQKTEKKTYEEPKVTKVEFDFKEVITISFCLSENSFIEIAPECFD